MRLSAFVPWLIGGLCFGAGITAGPSAQAQEDVPAGQGDSGDETAAAQTGKEGEAPPAQTEPAGDTPKEEDKLGGWGVGGGEDEGKFKPKGKTGKLKELEEEREEERKRDEEPLDIGPAGSAWVDFATTPGGSIIVPVQDSGATAIEPGASFLIGVSYRFRKKWELGLRFGVSSVASDGPRAPLIVGSRDSDSFKQIATGNLELALRPHFQLTQSIVLPVGLALALPTSMGDMFAGPDERSLLAQYTANEAANAMRGWEDKALWEPHRFGITPSVGVMWQRAIGPGKLKLEGRTKVELMMLTGGNDPSVDADTKVATGEINDVAVSWLLGATGNYQLLGGLLEPGLKLWLAYATAPNAFGTIDVSGAQFVFEPNVRTHLGFNAAKTSGFDGRLGFTLPAAGPLGSGNQAIATNIWALRVSAGLFF